VVASKIHPIKVPQPESIAEILEKLQAVLKGTPPPWLRKALQKDAAPSFDCEDDEVTHG
jgi:nitrogen fixation protein NifX